jgi:hypothetical protein
MVAGVQLLLSLLGIGIGLGIVNPAGGDNPDVGTFSTGAAIWWGISSLIALIIGGYVAGRLAGVARPLDGALHGLLTWALTLVVTVGLLSTAVGGLIGGALNVVGTTFSAAGQGAREVVPQLASAAGLTPDEIRQQVQDLLNAQSSGTDPGQMDRDQATWEITANLPKLASGGDQARQARDRIVAIMAAQLNISPEDANARLDQLQAQVDQTRARLAEQARAAASNASRASIWGFVALLIGAGAAAVGGRLGTRHPDRLAWPVSHRRAAA